MMVDPTLSIRNRARNRKMSSTITIRSTSRSLHFKSCPPLPLFPSRDRVPWEL
jgi:hypothetical protein